MKNDFRFFMMVYGVLTFVVGCGFGVALSAVVLQNYYQLATLTQWHWIQLGLVLSPIAAGLFAPLMFYYEISSFINRAIDNMEPNEK